MQAHKVAKVSELPPGRRKIVQIGDREIGVLNVNNRYHAFRNICPHQFAPICSGRVDGRVTSASPHQLQYETEPTLLLCPWHLWEFDLETGASLVDPALKLKKYRVDEIDGDVFVYV